MDSLTAERGTKQAIPTLRPAGAWVLFAVLLMVFIFSVFSLTSSELAFGYEGQHIDEAEGWVSGRKVPSGTGGVLEIIAYVPSALLKTRLAATGHLVSIQRIAYVFVQPALATLLCLVFFGLALELYRRPSTASMLTLLLAFTTMIWPYAKFGMEVQQALWMLASVWALLVYLRRPGLLAAAAFGLGLMALALTKITGVVHCAALIGAACWLIFAEKKWRHHGFFAQFAVVIGLGALALAALFLTNRLRCGDWFRTDRYNFKTELRSNPLWEYLAAALLSPGKSLFVFSPPLLIGLWYVRRFLIRFPRFGALYAAMLLLMLWYLKKSSHFYDETWGPRRLLWMVPLMLLPLGCWWESRPSTARLWRWTAGVVIAAGLLVQFLAISFDYTAHPFVLGNKPLYSIENVLWLPQLNPLRFNVHLYKSLYSKTVGQGSRDFVFQQDYVPWNAPKDLPPPLRFSVAQYDHLDLWPVQEQSYWGRQAFWFRQASFYVALVLVVTALLSMIGLLRWCVCRTLPISPGQEKRQMLNHTL